MSDIRVGIQCRLYLARVAPVMTSRTPGSASALEASMFLMVACA